MELAVKPDLEPSGTQDEQTTTREALDPETVKNPLRHQPADGQHVGLASHRPQIQTLRRD